jgi:hypothetical protein
MLGPSEGQPDGTDCSSLLHSNLNSPAGILSTSEQMEWVKARQRPNRCIFSALARRHVIRPDHFCGWTASWIGKRNHKFFWLFNFWGSVYIVTFTVFVVKCLWRDIQTEQVSPLFAIYILYAFMGAFFALMTLGFTFGHGYGILVNQTSWEEWNKIPASRFNKGVMNNIEDVCGPRKKWWTWLFPVGPWGEKSNEDFVVEYGTYRDGDRRREF